MKRVHISLIIICLSFLFYNSSHLAKAQVSVNTGGSSDGESLVSAKGPKGINKTILTSDKGGSIMTAAARSKFSKTRIVHGNKVISKGTDGDSELTHVDANSIFAGTATFKSDDGEPVDNFTIDLGISGTLKCKTTDPEIPPFFSLAQMAADVIVDGATEFSGTATQDGAGPFSASGNLSAGDFKTSANTAKIKKSFSINLGTLSDGQKLAFFFAGSTLVSYGADVPITFCSADFFNTDSFQPASKQAGKLSIEAGKIVDVAFIDNLSVSGDEILFIESEDDTLLSNVSDVRVVIALGGGIFNVVAGTVGDVDSDGINDAVITANTPANQAAMISAIQNSSNNTLFVFGQTSSGDAFSGTLNLSSSP